MNRRENPGGGRGQTWVALVMALRVRPWSATFPTWARSRSAMARNSFHTIVVLYTMSWPATSPIFLFSSCSFFCFHLHLSLSLEPNLFANNDPKRRPNPRCKGPVASYVCWRFLALLLAACWATCWFSWAPWTPHTGGSLGPSAASRRDNKNWTIYINCLVECLVCHSWCGC